MVALVNLINVVLTPIFDVICWPFRALAPVWALTVISFASGIFLVWLFGKTSDQDRIHEIRDRIRGNLIGVRLFQHDIGVVLSLQGRIFGDTFRFMRLALVPLVIMMVPVVLIMTQLNLRFAVRPLETGEPVLVKALVRDATALDRPIALDVPDGVVIETPPVKIRSTREIAWRLRVDRPGDHALVVRVGEDTIEKRIAGGTRWGSVVQLRSGRGMLDTLLYPGEPPIATSLSIEAIEIAYPPLEMHLLGFSVDWLIGFFVLSMVCGFAFKGVLGVEV
ncbi:MAG TPA: hypothetical protein QF572_12720 [Vicinamibacterales bacterium]|jgi:hypothetical protein|nr:hypothetical protein [Vicinamibacterales bacterium]|tara:strand:- start:371 stop:1204 length:834 start_codon:yes stop_codon:yes gene_type:complete